MLNICVSGAGTNITVEILICCKKYNLEEFLGKQFNKESFILLED
jgi:hypothetical protein